MKTLKGISLILIAVLSLCVTAGYAGTLDPRLASLAAGHILQANPAIKAFKPAPPDPFSPRLDTAGRVQVYIFPTSPYAALPDISELTALGTVKVLPSNALHVVQAWVPVDELHALAALPDVGRVTVPAYAVIHPPIGHAPLVAVTNQKAVPAGVATGLAIDASAVQAMQANLLQTVNAKGAGVKVGVISDDNSGLAASQAAGYLPATVWADPNYPGTTPTPGDPAEGTAMLEEVHAMAPDSSLGFCGSATLTSADFVTCYQDFVSWGANIIVDDLGFPDIDMFTTGSTADGSFAAAIANITQANPKMAFTSAAGNDAYDYFQALYTPGPGATINGTAYTSLMDFGAASGGASNTKLAVTFGSTDQFSPNLEWNDPLPPTMPPTSFPDVFVLYLENSAGTVLATGSLSYASDNGRPLEFFTYTPASAGEADFLVIACQSCADPVTIKLLGWGDGAVLFGTSTAGSTYAGQKAVTGILATAAVGVSAQSPLSVNLEAFSNIGPFLYGDFGATNTVPKPDITGVDSVTVSGAGGFSGGPTPTGVTFCGTSATSPNVGSLIADMMSADPGQPASFYYNALESSADKGVFGSTPFSGCGGGTNPLITGYAAANAGAGLAQGYAALQLFFTFPSTSLTAPIQVADGATGSYTLPVNVAVPFTAAVKGGTNAISASNCQWSAGTATASGATVNWTFPSAGSYVLSVNCPDSQGILGPTPPTVNVTAQNIPPPTVTISGSSQSGFSLTLTGYEPLAVTGTSSNTAIVSGSGITLSSGCGTTTLNCTVGLSPVAQANGSTTITINAADPFGQTGSGTASESYSYTPPPPPPPPASKGSGGGSMGIWGLLLFGGLLLLRGASGARRKIHAQLLGALTLCVLTAGAAWAGTLDPRLEALANQAAPQATSSTQPQSPFAPRIDSAGNVQVYIIPISPTAPLPSTEELTALGAIKIMPSDALHLVQAWVPIAKLQTLAALPDVGRVTVPAYGVPQHALVSAPAPASHKNTAGGSMGILVLLALAALIALRFLHPLRQDSAAIVSQEWRTNS